MTAQHAAARAVPEPSTAAKRRRERYASDPAYRKRMLDAAARRRAAKRDQ